MLSTSLPRSSDPGESATIVPRRRTSSIVLASIRMPGVPPATTPVHTPSNEERSSVTFELRKAWTPAVTFANAASTTLASPVPVRAISPVASPVALDAYRPSLSPVPLAATLQRASASASTQAMPNGSPTPCAATGPAPTLDKTRIAVTVIVPSFTVPASSRRAP
jgi:hypothetical protein